ncbi:hypothetical protein AXK11_09095 [Cephaloticoccus primus]|uniref:Uncharacterized protein n=1 Tax=Cephaloticoccus primus TaxID=1548207 RepID=A0A139SHS8_9BACT|nr:hypothetical protein [Cephaloticoccus primus]KXU34083.1 hypothetical protein AXK11_09095 [Cephaloticoccus primus]
MASKKTVSPLGVVIDLAFVAGFFLIIFNVVQSHVPSNDPAMVLLWSVLTAACLSGTFWIAIQMFRVVLRAQLQRNRGERG